MSEATDHTNATNYWVHTLGEEPGLDGHGPVHGRVDADLVIVGAGFTGLWAALHASEITPDLRVVVVEQATIGFGASGRNGGFCSADVTHGFSNSLLHFASEARRLDELGLESFEELVAFIRAHDIDCDLVESGTIRLAKTRYEQDELARTAASMREYGVPGVVVRGEELRAEIDSPLWRAGLALPGERVVMLNPLKLARGLAHEAMRRGITIHTHSPAVGAFAEGIGVRVDTPAGHVHARHLLVATSAYSGWLRSLRKWFAPVYDYAMVSDPVDATRLDAAGLRSARGFLEASNQFHYFRRLPDNRVLWGGYDAVYYPGSKVAPRLDHRTDTFARLRTSFAASFPQLADLQFPFQWGGAIDTTTRFTVTFGRILGGRGVYALGYTGHGVGATRWAGRVAVDMLLRPDADVLRLRFVRTRPMPFPPEPLRAGAIAVMKRLLARADRRGGRRGIMLRALDRLGIGFDS